jgi:hypothetical protein
MIDSKLQKDIATLTRERQKQEAIDDIKKAIDLIFNQLNRDERIVLEAFKQAVPYQHRTLQQLFFKTFNDFAISFYDDMKLYADPRNEDSLAFCKKLKALDHFFRYI